MMTDKRGCYDILIAPYNATDSAKSFADVILTGAQDQILINQAISGLDPKANIGFFSGDIKINGPINVPFQSVFGGMSAFNNTRIFVDSTNYSSGFTMIQPVASGGTTQLILRNIQINGCNTSWTYYTDVKCIHNIGGFLQLENVSVGAKMEGIYQSGGDIIANNLQLYGDDKSNVGSVGLNLVGTGKVIINNVNYLFNNIGYYETGIKTDASCTLVYISGMSFANSLLTTPINNASPNLILNNCFNSNGTTKFDNKGTATIAQGATSVVVTHNMAMLPRIQDIEITPGASCIYWISNITSTQFTINIASAAPAGGINFGWHCKLY